MSHPPTSPTHRYRKLQTPTLQSWRPQDPQLQDQMKKNAVVDCGWGNILFAHTFEDPAELVNSLLKEKEGRRDIAFYVKDPHVLLSSAPSEIFLDPSHTFRLWFENYQPEKNPLQHVRVRRLHKKSDVEAVNNILISQGMVPLGDMYVWKNRNSRTRTLLLAETLEDQQIVGFCMGVHHKMAFNDPERGSSLWSLSVLKNCPVPRVGEILVRRLAEHYIAGGCSFMDLSVMHDNTSAINLYKKLGFERVPVFSVKLKNSINMDLFTGPELQEQLNPYADIIINEARRRGIKVQVIDTQANLFQLSWGGVTHMCRESLTDLTSSISFFLCDEKQLTSKFLTNNGYRVPQQIQWSPGQEEKAQKFLERYKKVVVKPSRGEQGQGVAAGLTSWEAVRRHIDVLAAQGSKVLMEEFVEGIEVRVVVIDYEVVAAAVRRPPEVTGSGQHTLQELIQRQNRKRLKETGGESKIPFDSMTEDTLAEQGFRLSDVLPQGQTVRVRTNCNLHTGGTLHDVTGELSAELKQTAISAARDLEIPVVGMDFIVPDIQGEDYWILEANERPGLANHEPQPTAEKFIDLLFPSTKASFGQ